MLFVYPAGFSNEQQARASRKWKGHWWPSRTSNPAGGVTSVSGGFDSHALPPYVMQCEAGSRSANAGLNLLQNLTTTNPRAAKELEPT